MLSYYQQDVAPSGPEGARLDDERHGAESLPLLRIRPHGRHRHGLPRKVGVINIVRDFQIADSEAFLAKISRMKTQT